MNHRADFYGSVYPVFRDGFMDKLYNLSCTIRSMFFGPNQRQPPRILSPGEVLR